METKPLSRNQLLGSLSAEDRLRLSPHLKSTALRAGQVLLRNGQPVQEIVFPARGVCSLIKTTEDGHTIEVLGIGSEGAVGAAVAFGQAESAGDVLVQIADEGALSLPLDVFKAELQLHGALSHAVTRYCEMLMRQLLQVGACNALHSAGARCCRWLLTTADRVGSEQYPMTQEMVAILLGIRRPTVTLILAELHRAGVIAYERRSIAILDREALVARACECYRALSPSRSKVA